MYSFETEILGSLPVFQMPQQEIYPRSPEISPIPETKDTPAFSNTRKMHYRFPARKVSNAFSSFKASGGIFILSKSQRESFLSL
jgi:hypothetical protein